MYSLQLLVDLASAEIDHCGRVAVWDFSDMDGAVAEGEVVDAVANVWREA